MGDDYGDKKRIVGPLTGSRSKTGLNGSNKCSKFEKKFERERTANFCFCPLNVSHNLGRKTRWKEKCVHIVTRIPLTMSGKYR